MPITASRTLACLLASAALALGVARRGRADDDVVTLATAADPGPIVADEPLAAEFSARQAARYLDAASLHWQKSKKCVTCHTNMGYMLARPALRGAQADSGEVRAFFEQTVTTKWAESPPQPAWSVVVSAGLTVNDLQTSGRLHPTTRKALETMWTLQRDDGGWNWPMCGWPPMESDEHYGVTLAALATGLAPEDYQRTEAAARGLGRLRQFLASHPAPSLHHRAMIAWASVRVDGLMDPADRAQVLDELLALQRPDGGWSTPALVAHKDFQRKDGKPHDTTTSDAYATGFVIVVARELGRPADDERVRRGLAWIKSHQRTSGKWFTRSPAKDSRHYLSNFGTAFAVLALQAGGELPGWPLGGP